MNECSHYTAGQNGARICDRCGAEVPVDMDTTAKDDLSRVLSMYGTPDHDTLSGSEERHLGAATRSVEYQSAQVVFTFQREDASQAPGSNNRWKLLLISDTASNNALTSSAAAQRFFGSRRQRE
jgi:hypothetical protein